MYKLHVQMRAVNGIGRFTEHGGKFLLQVLQLLRSFRLELAVFSKIMIVPMGGTMGKMQHKLVRRLNKITNHTQPCFYILAGPTTTNKLFQTHYLNCRVPKMLLSRDFHFFAILSMFRRSFSRTDLAILNIFKTLYF